MNLPKDGSFEPSAARSSAQINCSNLRFLSYWTGLLLQLLISRVKLIYLNHCGFFFFFLTPTFFSYDTVYKIR